MFSSRSCSPMAPGGDLPANLDSFASCPFQGCNDVQCRISTACRCIGGLQGKVDIPGWGSVLGFEKFPSALSTQSSFSHPTMPDECSHYSESLSKNTRSAKTHPTKATSKSYCSPQSHLKVICRWYVDPAGQRKSAPRTSDRRAQTLIEPITQADSWSNDH